MLKAKLIQNPRGTRSISEYMQDVRSAVDALSLVDSQPSDEDVFLSVITQSGTEYDNFTPALRARDSATGFDDLCDRLRDIEIQLQKDGKLAHESPSIPTVHYTNKTSKTRKSTVPNYQPPAQSPWRHNTSNQSYRQSWKSNPQTNCYMHTQPNRYSNHQNRASPYCHFCNKPNHHTKDCRQLAKFLSEFGVQPQTNCTTTNSRTPSTWMFDSGPSHLVTSDLSNLSNYSNYDGSGLTITHTGQTKIHTPTTSLALNNVFICSCIKEKFDICC